MNCVHFQLAMLAYNLNCWLMLFNREEQAKAEDLRHTTLATARLRFLFLAAKIVRHAGAVLVRYSDHYAEQGTMTAVNGSVAFDRAEWQSVRARAGVGPSAMNIRVHKILCTAGPGVRMTYKRR